MKADRTDCMLVSIAINNYNYGRFIREAIESALNQDYGNCEVIIVDDGSTDNSRQIIDEYRGRAKVVFKANGGQASAFNAGLSQAKGGIVLFLDSDDYLFPNAVSQIVASWKPNISRCQFRLREIDGEGRQIGEMPHKGSLLSRGDLVGLLFKKRTLVQAPTSGNAFNRAALEKIFPIDERFRICVDAWLVYHTAAFGEVLAIEEMFGAYRVHGSNNYIGYNVDSSMTDSRMLKILKAKLEFVHIKMDAALVFNKTGESFYSIAGNILHLGDIRTLLLSKHFRIAGPIAEFDNQFGYFKLHALLLGECFHNESKWSLSGRLQCLLEMVILSVAPNSWKKRLLHVGVIAKRRAQALFGSLAPS